MTAGLFLRQEEPGKRTNTLRIRSATMLDTLPKLFAEYFHAALPLDAPVEVGQHVSLSHGSLSATFCNEAKDVYHVFSKTTVVIHTGYCHGVCNPSDSRRIRDKSLVAQGRHMHPYSAFLLSL